MASKAGLTATTIHVIPATNLAPVPTPGTEDYLKLAHTDHMLVAKWSAQNGWDTPHIKPYGELGILPTSSCLHYATECFEGLKAYRGEDGKLRLFRPDQKGERLEMSAKRASLPTVQPDQLKHLIEKLLELKAPSQMVAQDLPSPVPVYPTDHCGNRKPMSFGTPQEALLFIVAAPYPDISKTIKARGQSSGLKLLVSPPGSARSWPGGVGYAKVGANYGPSLEAHNAAKAIGFDQVLWVFGDDQSVTEAGASNFFIIWKNKQTQELELVTPTLNNHLILGGITRKSVLELAKPRLSTSVGDLAPLKVSEVDFSMNDIEEASDEGRIVECFVSGTAYFITPVSLIKTASANIEIPVPENDQSYAATIKAWLESITYGLESHEWSYLVPG
ncbi:cytosolic branched-chain amino acid aminotransferase [Penicillium malachiteum]|uniref:Branched-chain-amino-acid aminotransferase n=1 Tax=Penicillium malachiteum TaxID=1324776 RepID=A0AAD6HWA2_9EURO|nr:cytosolic branched-chain amino acid aminotransferase [Penicillium malachiteum]